VIAIARLTLANMAADSGVLPRINLVRSSLAIRRFPPIARFSTIQPALSIDRN
jgi:hypothetical protein